MTTAQAAQMSPPPEAAWCGDVSVSGGVPPRDHGPGPGADEPPPRPTPPGGLARRVIDIMDFGIDGSLRAPVGRSAATFHYQRDPKGTA